MPYITTNDNTKIYYDTSGAGKPIVLIPGLAQDHTCWGQLKKELEKQFTVITVDNRGSGKSDSPSSFYTLEQMADDLNLVLESLSYTSYNLIGHSMGSYIAQLYAHKHPSKLNKVVLISTRPKSSEIMKKHYEVTLSLINKQIDKELLIKNSMCWCLSENYIDNHSCDYINNVLSREYPSSLQGLAGQISAINNFNNEALIKKIGKPVCLIHGDEDRITPIAELNKIARHFQDAETNIIEETGHLPHIKNHLKTAEIIKDFFK